MRRTPLTLALRPRRLVSSHRIRRLATARITVAGPEIVGVPLTAAAYAHGLALALPEKVEMARPTGFRRAGAHARLKRIPIEGANSWETAASNSA